MMDVFCDILREMFVMFVEIFFYVFWVVIVGVIVLLVVQGFVYGC